MRPRTITERVHWLGAEHWDRRLFDSLIPLPDGTSYNAYLVKGSNKTALLDSVDPAVTETLMKQLDGVDSVDYVVSHHAEQDHAGSIPAVLHRFAAAKVLASPKGKGMLVDHLHIPEERIVAVEDGQEVSLGDRTLRFVHTPWVHWPETMCTYVPEEKILFSCDFFGSHIASTDLYVADRPRVYEAAKRYYAEIMMPFRPTIEKNIRTIDGLAVKLIAPSHGPIYPEPSFIIDAYKDWIDEKPKNLVVVPYVSMHGSTARMVDQLVSALAERGVGVQQFELSVTDIGKLAISLVDAATVVIGTPTVHVAPHPAVVYATYLANILRPKLAYASVIGSFGWSSRAVEKIAGMIPNLKVELIDPVVCRGYPKQDDLAALNRLAEAIAQRHRAAELADVGGMC